jgi:hypothetical protein
MKFVVVELDTGEQEFFENSYQAFAFARKHEAVRPHSVDYVAIGGFETEDDFVVWRGQELRLLLRSLDNIRGWVRAGRDQISAMD